MSVKNFFHWAMFLGVTSMSISAHSSCNIPSGNYDGYPGMTIKIGTANTGEAWSDVRIVQAHYDWQSLEGEDRSPKAVTFGGIGLVEKDFGTEFGVYSSDRADVYFYVPNDASVGDVYLATIRVESSHNSLLCQGTFKVNVRQGVRLQHDITNQCLFSNASGTDHWGCWDDPNMRYTFLPAGDKIRIMHNNTGRCLGAGSSNGAAVPSPHCNASAQSQLYEILDNDDGSVRLKNVATGRCLYASDSGNGGKIRSSTCWGDPNFVFHLID